MDKGMMMLNRNDLIYLDDDGRERAYNEARTLNPGIPGKLVYEMIVASKIPAIVKRQSSGTGGHTERISHIEVGFSSWRYIDGKRLRVQSVADTTHITEIKTPYQIAELFLSDNDLSWRCPDHYKAVEALSSMARGLGITTGLYGSAALAAATTLPYINESSNLDLLIKDGRYEDISVFHNKISQERSQVNINLDVELDIGGGYHIRLIELFSGQSTIMAKGLYDIKLIDMQDIASYLTISP